MKIAILGATGHIAKGLVENFISGTDYQLFLFSRKVESFTRYPIRLPKDRVTILSNDSFGRYQYDGIINCVGVGDPQKVKELGGRILSVTEEFDNLVLDYLASNRNCRYINFSSGAVYGKELRSAIGSGSKLELAVNAISEKDYYAISKLNSEAKHRSALKFSIVDIRVFSYFSRHINLKARFFITEILNSIIEGKIFATDSADMTRDYIGPDDLASLVNLCLKSKTRLNLALDVYSKRPVTKMQILDYFTKNFQLKWKVRDKINIVNATGRKNQYFSTYKKAETIGYQPSLTSLEIISRESQYILTNKG